MAQYLVRRRKGRSMRQKAQMHELNQRRSQLGGGDHTNTPPTSNSQCNESTLLHVSTTNVSLVHRDEQFNDLRRKYKNAMQREKRAKGKINKLEAHVDEAYAQLSTVCQALSDTTKALEHAVVEANTSADQITTLQNHLSVLEQEVSQGSRELVYAFREIDSQNKRISALEIRQLSTNRARDALRKKLERKKLRDQNVITNALVQEYCLKDPMGTIQPAVRDMLRKLACQGVATKRMSDVINIVAEGLGIGIIGTVNARNVGRIMLEGLIKASIQIAHELRTATAVSICGDGTTIKNQQHESKSLYLQLPTQGEKNPTGDGSQLGIKTNPAYRNLGVYKAVSHTAQQQFTGWLNAFEACCRRFNQSPFGQNAKIASSMVSMKLRGILTDHAADQKRFVELMVQWKKKCDREACASSHLGKMTTEEQLSLLSNYLDSATNCINDWRSLPAEKQSAIMHDAWFALAYEVGETEFLKMDSDSQFDTDFVAWAGCCMHKELNAIKGGVHRMSGTWETLKLTPPLELKNKHQVEAGTQSFGANASSIRGGIKLLSLAGALFNNKDDKKGYQQTVDNYFQRKYGYSKRFPDTSNTRYGSYCDAAVELLMHQEDYLCLMELVRDSRAKRKFVNIERNIYEGLQDIPTLTELTVLVLYEQPQF